MVYAFVIGCNYGDGDGEEDESQVVTVVLS